jgi:hypothetical protein
LKRKAFFIVILLLVAAIVPLLAIGAQAILSAGPNQTAYTGQTVKLMAQPPITPAL